jgi:hypothetical protein
MIKGDLIRSHVVTITGRRASIRLIDREDLERFIEGRPRPAERSSTKAQPNQKES